MVSIIRILVFFMCVFPAFIFSAPLFGYMFSSLSKEQSENLFIDGIDQLHACPVDTLRPGVMAMDYRLIPPMVVMLIAA